MQKPETVTVPGLYGDVVIPLRADAKKVYVELTTFCNFSCTTCMHNVWDERKQRMSKELFYKLLGDLEAFKELEWVHLGGFGEPLTHPDLLEFIKELKSRGYKVELITNGALLTQEMADAFIELGLDRLFMSVDGAQVETYNSIRQGGDYQNVLTNFGYLVEQKFNNHLKQPELGFEFVLMKSNYKDLPKVAKLAHQLRLNQLLVTNLLPYTEDMVDQILYTQGEELELPELKEMWVTIRAQLPSMRIGTTRYCKWMENKALSITSAGKVSPCNPLMHSYSCYIFGRKKKIKPHYLGNINEQSLADIWMQKDYAVFRHTIATGNYPSCTDCSYRDGCSYIDDNDADCWGNSPSCAECLWSRNLIICP